jgi:hypothetical protein
MKVARGFASCPARPRLRSSARPSLPSGCNFRDADGPPRRINDHTAFANDGQRLVVLLVLEYQRGRARLPSVKDRAHECISQGARKPVLFDRQTRNFVWR